MKFVVDELPYYRGNCPICQACCDRSSEDKCPRYWDKYKVCSDENPHECQLLIEAENKKNESEKEESRCCNTCAHLHDLSFQSYCAPCFGYSNWEEKDV